MYLFHIIAYLESSELETNPVSDNPGTLNHPLAHGTEDIQTSKYTWNEHR